MVNVSATGGKGGEGYSGGVEGRGGDAGVHVIAGKITELSTLVNIIQNNPTLIVQKFDTVINEIENDKTLTSEQKLKTKSTLETIKNAFTTAEPYARPFIVKALESLALAT